MTTKELEDRIMTIRPYSYGHYTVKIKYKNKIISGITSNTLAIDRINSKEDISYKTISCTYTYKQALEDLYNQIKNINI